MNREMEHWIEINFSAELKVQDKILLDFVRPHVARLKKKGSLVRWHFFREPQIRLRVRLNSRRAEQSERKAIASLADTLVEKDLVTEWYFGNHGRRGRRTQARRTGTAGTGGRWPRTTSKTGRRLLSGC